MADLTAGYQIRTVSPLFYEEGQMFVEFNRYLEDGEGVRYFGPLEQVDLTAEEEGIIRRCLAAAVEKQFPPEP